MLADLLDAFVESEPRLVPWSTYPDVTEEQDEGTDAFACHQASAAFAAFVAARGIPALVVTADGFVDPWVGAHAWTEVRIGEQVTAVDFTARQFHNLDGPAADAALTAPWPLTWSGTSPLWHPIAGRFTGITITPFIPTD